MRMRSFSLFKKASTEPHIITGEDGDLIISPGQTVSIPAGSIKQYENINISAGGVLEIIGSTLTKTEIGCKGFFILNGSIICRTAITSVSESVSGTTTLGAKPYSVTLNQNNGGAGAAGGNGGGPGGAQNMGYGGGGGGGTSALSESAIGSGGAGGVHGISNGSSGGAGGGGSPGTGGLSGTGTAGGGGGGGGGGSAFVAGGGKDPENVSPDTYSGSGGGGGGGVRGLHGGFLFLYLEKNISGTGTILVNGLNGSPGAAGGGTNASGAGSGGQGGGGAGGSGGHLLVYKRSQDTWTPSVSYSGGGGGAGGNYGANGNNGSSSINNWNI